MAYQATVIRIMIAGPSDVSVPKNVIRQTIEQWNTMHSPQSMAVLLPISWDTHSSPSMHAPPQAVINDQLDYDILVAVFWTKLGTPTEHAASGTAEEINRAIGFDKRVMVYFSDMPVVPASIDQEQYASLVEFKEDLFQRGLCSIFDSQTDLSGKFTVHLNQAVNELIPDSWPSHPAQPPIITPLPTLSSEERELLLAAVAGDGTVIHILSMGGTMVSANNQEFVAAKDMRSEAKWRSVVKNLALKNLIEDRAGRGELYFVTDEGFRVAGIIDTESST